MTDMKYIVWKKRGKVLHIETPLGIVNIRVGLQDRLGRDVDSISVVMNPDYEHIDRKIKLSGYGNTRLIALKGKNKK